MHRLREITGHTALHLHPQLFPSFDESVLNPQKFRIVDIEGQQVLVNVERALEQSDEIRKALTAGALNNVELLAMAIVAGVWTLPSTEEPLACSTFSL